MITKDRKKIRGWALRHHVLFLTIWYIISISVCVVTVAHWFTTEYEISADTEQYIDLAVQAKTDRALIKHYLIKAQDGMEKWNIIDAHRALVWRGPENSNRVTYEIITQVITMCDNASLYLTDENLSQYMASTNETFEIYMNPGKTNIGRIEDAVHSLAQIDISKAYWCEKEPAWLFMPSAFVIFFIFPLPTLGILNARYTEQEYTEYPNVKKGTARIVYDFNFPDYIIIIAPMVIGTIVSLLFISVYL